MRFEAPTWNGAFAGLAQQGQYAHDDMAAGMGLKYALWGDRQKHRDAINALLRRRAEQIEREKAAKKENAWGGLLGGGAGMAAGALLAAPTGGMSMLAGAGLGAGLGATAGGAVDMAMGNDGRGGMQLGSTLTDFATEFLPTTPNPFYQAAQQTSGYGPGAEFMQDSYGGGGFALPPNRAEY